jgi:carbamoyl-phosphate synthase small subunit
LKSQGVVGLYGIDTRRLTKLLRERGVMNGRITREKPVSVPEGVREYAIRDAVKSVSTTEARTENAGGKYKVALLDYGIKENIVRELVKRDCEVRVFPHDAPAETALAYQPDGVMLSNGPGDPEENTGVIAELRKLSASGVPIFGICLGHQLLALAHGFRTSKLKYGHRGGNQPAKDVIGGRTYITSQNHGYAVLSESIDPKIADEWFINVNDNTNEGIIYRNAPIRSVQFHPEACGGPRDTAFLFDLFINEMEVRRHAAG